eukprot:Gb_19259 [translate_table: standard]
MENEHLKEQNEYHESWVSEDEFPKLDPLDEEEELDKESHSNSTNENLTFQKDEEITEELEDQEIMEEKHALPINKIKDEATLEGPQPPNNQIPAQNKSKYRKSTKFVEDFATTPGKEHSSSSIEEVLTFQRDKKIIKETKITTSSLVQTLEDIIQPPVDLKIDKSKQKSFSSANGHQLDSQDYNENHQEDIGERKSIEYPEDSSMRVEDVGKIDNPNLSMKNIKIISKSNNDDNSLGFIKGLIGHQLIKIRLPTPQDSLKNALPNGYAWYASYESNMWKPRILYYIKGGQAETMATCSSGSKDIQIMTCDNGSSTIKARYGRQSQLLSNRYVHFFWSKVGDVQGAIVPNYKKNFQKKFASPMTKKAESISISSMKGDYMFLFQHVVITMAEHSAPKVTLILAGLDDKKGDPLGCYEGTQDSFAHMAHRLNNPAKEEFLIVLEDGYNLQFISTLATTVVKW